ncbi:hypothetical protein BZL30_2256 [Mycobacterium kansasii]|nr:hypothetical protein BZL30_2256 [Mycobacterium kansasii]
MAAFMTSRISAEMPPPPDGAPGFGGEGGGLQLPEFVRAPFSAAMSQSMLLPAFIALFGIVAALFLVGGTGATASRRLLPQGDHGDDYQESDEDFDDDDYVEYILQPEPDRWHRSDGEIPWAYRQSCGEPVDVPSDVVRNGSHIDSSPQTSTPSLLGSGQSAYRAHYLDDPHGPAG